MNTVSSMSLALQPVFGKLKTIERVSELYGSLLPKKIMFKSSYLSHAIHTLCLQFEA